MTQHHRQADTMTRWFWWSNWAPEKLEVWLEEKAAQGWHLTKADRWLLRFTFVRGAPKTIRVCADWPADASNEYLTIFEDAGWQLLSDKLGWHLWQMEYSGSRRPEAFTDVDGLIERNTRMLVVFAVCLTGLLYVQWTSSLFASTGGKILLAFFIAMSLALITVISATFATIRKLSSRKG